MKLSFLFELLLILIIIAFAASKPIAEGLYIEKPTVTSFYTFYLFFFSADADPMKVDDNEVAKQSNTDNAVKPSNDDDDDDVFGFGKK